MDDAYTISHLVADFIIIEMLPMDYWNCAWLIFRAVA